MVPFTRKQRKVVCNEDIVSNLSEEVLSRILSRLPIQDAVRTTILSRKWRNMWTAIKDLHFDYSTFPHSKLRDKKEYFLKFLKSVVFHPSGLKIRSLVLKCGSRSFDLRSLNEIVSAVITDIIQKLEIANLGNHIMIPCCSINNCHIQELNLQTKSSLVVDTALHLPNLILLNMEKVTIVNKSYSDTFQLHFSFPKLETFVARGCMFSNAETVVIDSPKLKRLTMIDFDLEGVPDGTHNLEIKVHAPCLAEFTYYGYLLEEFVLTGSSVVRKAIIRLSLFGKNTNQVHEMGFNALMLLNNLASATHLILENQAFEALVQTEDLSDLCSFHRLTHLEICLRNTTFGLGRTLMEFLQLTPFLESLVFTEQFPNYGIGYLLVPMVRPAYLASLRRVVLDSFNGKEHELCLVEYFLENAEVLEDMIITASPELRMSDTTDIETQLLEFPRSSDHASVVFHLENVQLTDLVNSSRSSNSTKDGAGLVDSGKCASRTRGSKDDAPDAIGSEAEELQHSVSDPNEGLFGDQELMSTTENPSAAPAAASSITEHLMTRTDAHNVLPNPNFLVNESDVEDVNRVSMPKSSHADTMKQVYAKHPDLMTNFQYESPIMKSGFIDSLLTVLDMLCRPPLDFTDEDVLLAEKIIRDLDRGGMQVEWVRARLDDICKERDGANSCIINDLNTQIAALQQKIISLSEQVGKETEKRKMAQKSKNLSDLL